jgi:hypothetical protein
MTTICSGSAATLETVNRMLLAAIVHRKRGQGFCRRMHPHEMLVPCTGKVGSFIDRSWLVH